MRTTHASAALLLALGLAACTAAGGSRTDTSPGGMDTDAPTVPAGDGVAAFDGKVEAIDNGCFADGVCSVTVAGRTIVTMRGWSQATWGTRDPDLVVGDAVAVRCRATADGCTLEGDAGLFVRKAPPAP